jgi:hypothetical protein
MSRKIELHFCFDLNKFNNFFIFYSSLQNVYREACGGQQDVPHLRGSDPQDQTHAGNEVQQLFEISFFL